MSGVTQEKLLFSVVIVTLLSVAAASYESNPLQFLEFLAYPCNIFLLHIRKKFALYKVLATERSV